MPAAPSLPTNVVAATPGHPANHNAAHTILNDIYKVSIGTTRSADYTLTQSNSGELIPVNSSTAVTITVPVLAVGTSIELYRQETGAVNLAVSGTTLVGPTDATLTPRIKGSVIALLWVTTTSVLVSGDLS